MPWPYIFLYGRTAKFFINTYSHRLLSRRFHFTYLVFWGIKRTVSKNSIYTDKKISYFKSKWGVTEFAFRRYPLIRNRVFHLFIEDTLRTSICLSADTLVSYFATEFSIKLSKRERQSKLTSVRWAAARGRIFSVPGLKSVFCSTENAHCIRKKGVWVFKALATATEAQVLSVFLEQPSTEYRGVNSLSRLLDLDPLLIGEILEKLVKWKLIIKRKGLPHYAKQYFISPDAVAEYREGIALMQSDAGIFG